MTPLYSDSPGLFDFESFRGQQSTFALLNLMLIAGLLIIHTTFTDYVGVPSSFTVALLTAGFILQAAALIWLRASSRPLLPEDADHPIVVADRAELNPDPGTFASSRPETTTSSSF